MKLIMLLNDCTGYIKMIDNPSYRLFSSLHRSRFVTPLEGDDRSAKKRRKEKSYDYVIIYTIALV